MYNWKINPYFAWHLYVAFIYKGNKYVTIDFHKKKVKTDMNLVLFCFVFIYNDKLKSLEVYSKNKTDKQTNKQTKNGWVVIVGLKSALILFSWLYCQIKLWKLPDKLIFSQKMAWF